MLLQISKDPSVVFCLSSQLAQAMPAVRRMIVRLMDLKIQNPVILMTESAWSSADEHLIHFATETGALFLDGMGDGICLGVSAKVAANAEQNNESSNVSGRNYFNNTSFVQFLNTISFLQFNVENV